MLTQLVFLDINGLLGRKIEGTPKNLSNCHHIGGYSFQLRPGCEKFIQELYARYCVGFFSSTPKKNGDKILQLILTPQQRNSTYCFWFRDRTRFDADNSEFDTIKVLEDFYQNPVANKDRTWSNFNTIIIDDDEKKVRFNNRENVLIVPSFTGNSSDHVLEYLLQNISEKFLNLQNKSAIKNVIKGVIEPAIKNVIKGVIEPAIQDTFPLYVPITPLESSMQHLTVTNNNDVSKDNSQ